MDTLHAFIGGAGENNTVAIAPESGKGEELLVGKLEVVGLFTFPFVEAVGRDEAAVGAEQVFEHGAFMQCFGAGIDNDRSRLWIPESPTTCHCSLGVILSNDGHFLGRGNVVAALEEWREFNFIQRFELFLSAFGLCKASAHDREIEPRIDANQRESGPDCRLDSRALAFIRGYLFFNRRFA